MKGEIVFVEVDELSEDVEDDLTNPEDDEGQTGALDSHWSAN